MSDSFIIFCLVWRIFIYFATVAIFQLWLSLRDRKTFFCIFRCLNHYVTMAFTMDHFLASASPSVALQIMSLCRPTDKFATVLRKQQEERRNREQQRIRLLTADPFDMEAQRLIANEIQQEVCVCVFT